MVEGSRALKELRTKWHIDAESGAWLGVAAAGSTQTDDGGAVDEVMGQLTERIESTEESSEALARPLMAEGEDLMDEAELERELQMLIAEPVVVPVAASPAPLTTSPSALMAALSLGSPHAAA